MQATDLELQEKQNAADQRERAYVRKRRRAIFFGVALIVLFAVVAAVVMDKMQNKLHLIDVTQLESVEAFDHLAQVKVSVHPQFWTRLVDNFSSSYLNLNPAKWKQLATLTLNFKDGRQTVIHVYDTRKNPGCFRIGWTYYTGGEERTISRIMSDQSYRDKNKQ